MKNISMLILFISTFNCFGQTENIQTEIKAKNIFDLSIIKVYPDSFPNVSVIFQAKNEFGKPLWILDKSEIQVKENQQDCEVIRLFNVSKNKPINIGLVFDHSGSMIENPAQLPKDVSTVEYYFYNGLPLPKGYVMAIDYAKEGVIEFLNETNVSNDSILFVGFSTTVDKIYPLTNDVSEIKSFVEKVYADGFTSFYDALFVSVDNLSKSSSKSVIVALTDGLDNQSTHSSQEVIDLANKNEIAIYNIGLGAVDTVSLKQISKKTDGFYYHTNNPEKLKEIYLNIKSQIRSIYQVDYTSNNLDYLKEERDIRFSFVNDTLEFSNNTAIYSLPQEAISYLKIKEEERISFEKSRMVFGVFGILLLGLGSFLVYRKRKKALSITKIYPNPFVKNLTVEYNAPKNSAKISLKMTDINGKIVFETEFLNSKGVENIQLENLNSGVYLIQISNDSNISKTLRVIKN